MPRRTVTIPAISRPTGAATATATATIWLVDADHRQMVGWSDGEGLIGQYQAELGDAPTSLALTPQTEIDGVSYWAVRIADGAQNQTYYVQVPAGSAPITLPELIGADAIEPGSILAGRLLPDPTDLADGRMLAVSSGAWIDTAAPSGSGAVAWGEITGTIADQSDLTPAAIGARPAPTAPTALGSIGASASIDWSAASDYTATVGSESSVDFSWIAPPAGTRTSLTLTASADCSISIPGGGWWVFGSVWSGTMTSGDVVRLQAYYTGSRYEYAWSILSQTDQPVAIDASAVAYDGTLAEAVTGNDVQAALSAADSAIADLEIRRAPDPRMLANGRMVAVSDGEWVDIAPPSGSGDMQSLVYDPRGIAADAFDLAHFTGVIDGGVFT